MQVRLFAAGGKVRTPALTEDLYLALLCGSLEQRAELQRSLRREAGVAPLTTVRVPLRLLLRKLGDRAPDVRSAAEALCAGVTDCVLGVVEPPGLSPEAGSGGDSLSNRLASAYNCGLFHSAAGHFEYTFDAARKKGFSVSSARFMATATQDVDEFEWFVAAAHAQVPNVRGGALFESKPGVARLNFIRWNQCRLAKLTTACAAPVEDRLYWLGYLLHGVQDLVFHQGISNAEHSYRDHALDEGVDCVNAERQRWAAEISEALIARAVAGLPAQCRDDLLAATAGEVTEPVRARTAGARDRKGAWLSDYFREGDAYARIVEEHIDDEATYRLVPHWVNVNGSAAPFVESLMNEFFAPSISDPCDPLVF